MPTRQNTAIQTEELNDETSTAEIVMLCGDVAWDMSKVNIGKIHRQRWTFADEVLVYDGWK